MVLYEHIFWIFGHPEVYLLVLPAFGIISDVISTISRKRLFGYHSMVFATVLIGFIGFMVWAHHLFAVGMGPAVNSVFGIATMLVGVPTGIKVFNWIFTLIGGKIQFNTAGLFAVSFIPNFVIGGVTGIMLASSAADFQFHDTYFVVGHFHYVIVGGIVQAVFAGMFYWWPKVFGKMLNETLGKWMFWLFLIGFNLTFYIQHFLGLWGMPRRVFTYLPNQGWDSGNFISTIGAFFMSAAVILLVVNVLLTFARGKKAGQDPWHYGRTLEWSIPSPPPEYNFAQTPIVRANDPWWYEKMQGHKEMQVAEPFGEIHMPNPSIIPMIMAFGTFIAGFGFIFENWFGVILGFGITGACMFFRSIKDDHGHHLHPEELHNDKGVHSV